MSKHRVPRTGRAMLTFFGDLIARQEVRSAQDGQEYEYGVRLFRTEAPGYVLGVRYGSGGATQHWAAHTPNRLKVAELFEQYTRENTPQGPARDLFAQGFRGHLTIFPLALRLRTWAFDVQCSMPVCR